MDKKTTPHPQGSDVSSKNTLDFYDDPRGHVEITLKLNAKGEYYWDITVSGCVDTVDPIVKKVWNADAKMRNYCAMAEAGTSASSKKG